MLSPGTRLGGYEVEALLGAGGMGEVYRARDTRLQRAVALKILPAKTADDPAAFARFEREAQAVAALSHPNILAVYDFGRSDAVSYVVFELLQGATLRERLGAGPLPVRKAIDYARQVADGLAAAHARGIAHRDIKPDNLFITDEGRVKILDFGLAQTATPGESQGGELAVTQASITDAGTVLGTVGYMAPEQVRGQVVDHRADLFALGVVLYEMCTGQRAFKGATPADTMTAVLSSEPPDLTVAGQATPPALERIVRRCLEKQPTERFQSARDLSFALDALSSLSGPGSGAGVATLPGRRRWMAAGAALVTLAAGAWLGRVVWPASPLVEPRVGPPLRMEFPSASGGTAISFQLALSPDGRQLAYSDNVGGTSPRVLLVRNLGTGAIEPVPDSADALVVSWSPRSDELLYFARRELRRFRLGERAAVPIFSSSENFRGGVWLSDDTVVFAIGGDANLRRIPAAGGADTPVLQSTELFQAPSAFGARADYVLVTRTSTGSATGRHIVAVRLADGHVAELIANDASAQYVPGFLLLPRPNGVFAAPFDEATMTVIGEPTLAGEPVIWDAGNGGTSLAVSQAGVVAFRPGRDRALQFEWLDRAGQSLGLVGPPAFYGSFALSPDGTRIVARQINQVGNRTALNLFLIDEARKVAAPVSTPPGALSDPIWTADGSSILYRFETSLIRQAPSSNSHEAIRQEQVYPDDVSPDGRWLLGGLRLPGGGFGLYVMPADGSGERQVIAEDGRASADEAAFSPDGRLIAYQSTRTGRPEIYLVRFPLSDDRWQLSPDGGLQARWSDDGRTLHYVDLSGRLMRVPIEPASPDKAGQAAPMFDLGIGPPSVLLEQYAVHGDRFLVLRPAADSAPQTIAVIGNWSSLLPRAAAPSR